MIALHHARTRTGDVEVMLHKADGSVSYRKGGVTQTRMDARGRNLAPHLDKAVAVLAEEGARQVLVLGHGGGMAPRLLYRRNIEVTSVDSDACAGPLGRLFFRAPPTLRVVVEDAARFAATAADAAFDGVLVDFQHGDETPLAYRDPAFWRHIVRVMRSGGVVVLVIPPALHRSSGWAGVQRALAAARLDSAALTSEFSQGWRLLVTMADR